jgi:phage FluMu protein Com
MFNIPGALLEYQMSGSSLTYRNESGIWLDFRQRCLGPIFAEPMEQQLSDMLTRSTTARFNYDQLLRADIKTRYEAYQIGVAAGFLSPEEIRQQEGMAPGGIEFAPVPQALPSAVPTRLPVESRSAAVRCSHCNKMLAEVATPPYRSICPRCKTLNEIEGGQPQESNLISLFRALSRQPDQPNITVYTPPVNVEPAQVTFQRGAIELAAPPPAEVNVTTPDITVEVAAPDMTGVAEALTAVADRPNPAPEVHITTPDINIPATQVTFEKGAVQSPDISVQPANVTVNVPEQPAPVVNMSLPEPRPIHRKIKRDKDSNITEIVEEPA